MTSPHSINQSSLSAQGILTGSVVFLLVVISGAALCWWPHPISPSGGLPIPGEIVISVPQFLQGDPQWGNDQLGNTPGSMRGEGCAVTSAAMVLSHYGMDVDPGRLNVFLKQHNGYEGQAWLKWESAAEYSPDLVEKNYEALPSYGRIDWNLLHGNPVIVRLRLPSGITHFVVIVGKRGFDYLIRDPSPRGEEKIYPLKELGVPIEALRYYRRFRKLDAQVKAAARPD